MKCKYEGSGVWEGRCVGTKEVDPCIGIEKCDRYKPDCQTNADRIRAMSDEELAKVVSTACPTKGCPLTDWDCTECWLNWLKQPVKDGEDNG